MELLPLLDQEQVLQVQELGMLLLMLVKNNIQKKLENKQDISHTTCTQCLIMLLYMSLYFYKSIYFKKESEF